jgi:hypothetical protein
MAPLPIEAIADLCRRHGATRLELFGSAVNGGFDDESDYDFFVEFDEARTGIDPYFDLKFALEELLGRPVDLVERGAVVNRTFLKATDRGRELIYAA